ncbi:MAG: hypothetical protein Q9177_002478, partial [Variospora cf. flavescens]
SIAKIDTNAERIDNFHNGFNLNVTSIDPSVGTACDLYEESDCWERYEGYPGPPPLMGIINPGVRNLEQQHWNKRAMSYICN